MGLLQRLRRGGMPGSVRAELPLASGERVLASAPAGEDGYLVATDRALYLPGGRRVGWEYIDRAEWRRGGVYVREVAPLGEGPAQHDIDVPDPHTVPDVVRDRVTSSIVINQYVRLEPKRGMRIVGRRRPQSDEVVWNLVFDAGVDVGDSDVRARAERLLVEVQRQTGL